MVANDIVLSYDGSSAITDAHQELDTLAPGAIAFFVEDGTVLTAANAVATLAGQKHVYVAQGGLTADDLKINKIIRSPASAYKKATYVAGTKHVIQVGENAATGTGSLNLPGSLVVGDILGIRVIQTVPTRELSDDKWRYEVTYKTGDTTGTLLARLVALINADDTIDVTAAVLGSDVGISISADNVNEVFEVTTDGVLGDATVYTDGTGDSVAVIYSVGSAADVAKLVEETAPEQGNTNKLVLADKYYNMNENNSASGTYDLYTAEWDNVQRAAGAKIRSETKQELIIATIQNPSTWVEATMDTIMAAIFNQGVVLND